MRAGWRRWPTKVKPHQPLSHFWEHITHSSYAESVGLFWPLPVQPGAVKTHHDWLCSWYCHGQGSGEREDHSGWITAMHERLVRLEDLL